MAASGGRGEGARVLFRVAVLALLVGGLAIGMAACMGSWLNPAKVPALLVGTPVISDGHGEVQVVVADMPEGGIASIAIGNLAAWT